MSLRAYASPSSRSTSHSPLITKAPAVSPVVHRSSRAVVTLTIERGAQDIWNIVIPEPLHRLPREKMICGELLVGRSVEIGVRHRIEQHLEANWRAAGASGQQCDDGRPCCRPHCRQPPPDASRLRGWSSRSRIPTWWRRRLPRSRPGIGPRADGCNPRTRLQRGPLAISRIKRSWVATSPSTQPPPWKYITAGSSPVLPRPHDANRDLTLWANRNEAVFAIDREFLNFPPPARRKARCGVFDRQLVDLRTTFGSQPIQEGLRVRFHDGIDCHES